VSATKLYHAGYADLVSVVPPNAPLAPGTRVKPETRGKVPGVRRRDGAWVGYDFLREATPTETDIAAWQSWGSNIGLQGTRFPALDLDVDDPFLSKYLTAEAQRILGPAPIRLSRGDRRLLVYRATEPFTKMTLEINRKGTTHKAEVLAHGQQYLVTGTHPSGTEYRWEEDHRPLWDWRASTLTAITPADVMAFFAKVQETLVPRGVVVAVKGNGLLRDHNVPPQESLLAPSLRDLAAVVARIPNESPHRDDYIAMGHAIKAAAGGGDAGLGVFLDWCVRWTDGTNEPETVTSDWNRMHPPFRVGWSWLQEQAGGIAAEDEFSADLTAEPPPPPTTKIAPGVIQFTDTWVVERLVPWLEPKIRYVPDTGRWHVWDGHSWSHDRRNFAEHMIRAGLTALSSEVFAVAQTAGEEEASRYRKFAVALQSRGALTKALPEIQAHPWVALALDDFDADPWLLNTPGGVVNLRNGNVTPPDPKHLFAKSTVVAPRPGPHPTWTEFLHKATNGDRELQRYLQKQVGYALTGSMKEQVLTFIHGPGATGKSTYIKTIAAIFGSYHETAPMETFAAAKNSKNTADLATLAGARLVTSVETQEGRAWDTQRVKAITGGDQVTARFLYGQWFTYTPTYKLLIVGNNEPEVRGVDDALMRRIHVVPFEHVVKEVDPRLDDKLHAEFPMILQWAIEGCLLWQSEGLIPPEIVVARTARYREEEDPVGRFLDEQCSFDDPNATVTRQDLYMAWCQWCHRQGEDAGTLKQMKRRFLEKSHQHQFYEHRVAVSDTSRVAGYRGLYLKTEGP